MLWMQRLGRDKKYCIQTKRRQLSPLQNPAERLLDMLVEQPDLALDETLANMTKAGISVVAL